MATSFLTSSVTRLRPNEWASRTAAGVATIMMSTLKLSSAQMAADVSRLQDQLRSLGVPLAFNLTLPEGDDSARSATVWYSSLNSASQHLKSTRILTRSGSDAL